MKQAQFTRLLDKLGHRGISRATLAALVGRHRTWLYHQEQGTVTIDQRVADYAAALLAAVDSVPVPDLSLWRNVEAAQNEAAD